MKNIPNMTIKKKALISQVLTARALTAAIGLVLLPMLVSCERDLEVEKEHGLLFVMSPYWNEEFNEPATRALPSGYSAFEPDGNATDVQVAVFVTETAKDSTELSVTGNFNYTENGQWKSFLGDETNPILVGTSYYLYGFMPAKAGTGKINSNTYSKGATMTVSNVNPVSAQDMVAITGVSTSSSDIAVGTYVYTPQYSKESNTANTVCMLLDHLLSKVTVNMSSSDKYMKLRRIVINSMTLSSSVNEGTLTVVMDSTGVKSSTFVPGTKASGSVSLDVTADTLKSTSAKMASFYCPKEVSSFSLTVSYDVLNAQGTKVLRSSCSAENAISMPQTFDRGVEYALNIQVAPSFLYKLTDEDLNSPAVTVTY